MDPLFDRILNSVRQFLKDVDELTRADEELLVKVEKTVQTVWRIEEKGDECINFLQDTCNRVLHSGYIILICKIAVLSKVCREMGQEESEFPKPMQPKVREIRSYMDSIQKQHEKIDACMEKIMTRIEEYADRESQTLSQREKNRLEIDLLKLEGDLEVAENYHKKAEKALDSLWSEINYYLKEEAAKGVVKAGATAVAAYVGAGLCDSTGVIKGAKAFAGTAAAVAGVLTLLNQVYSLLETRQDLRGKWNAIESDLSRLKTETEAKQKLADKKKKMGDLFEVQD